MLFRKTRELEGLVKARTKALRDAEDKIQQRNRLLKSQTEEIKILKEKIVDLENNVEILFNNLTPKKKELVRPEIKTNSKTFM